MSAAVIGANLVAFRLCETTEEVVNVEAGPANGGLTAEDGVLDFGETLAVRDFHWILPLHNPTDEAVRVQSLTGSCWCAAPSPSSFNVAPGDTAEIDLTLNLLPKNPAEAAAPWRHFAVRFVPTIVGAPGQPGWEIRGRVASPLAVIPSTLRFGDNVARNAPTISRTAEVRSREPLESLQAECPADLAEASVSRHPSDASLFYLRVTPRNDLALGALDFRVLLRGRTIAGGELPAVPVYVEGRVCDDVRITPSTIVLDPVRSEATVALTCRSGAGITEVVVGDNKLTGLRIAPLENEDDTTWDFRVAWEESARGTVGSERIRFTIWRRGDLNPIETELTVITRARQAKTASGTHTAPESVSISP